ncbi:MAG: hypothetical protein HY899_03305 [Deltaproteobacteria bacterium]|nr:hypothetical protein [Deltaproteobacteria bacterium]
MVWNKKHEEAGSLVAEAEAAPPPPQQPAEESPRVEAPTASTGGVAAFFEALLPMVGVLPSTVREFPGLVRILRGPGEDEATLHIDMATKPLGPGEKPSLERVVTLSVRLDHDYRLLGNGYYCIDCDLPQNDTVH